ncbi:MAG TPA: intradiol ring-cleavage dioxygenase [Ohtaekwangia sp.]|nr:intradiol ring-cleavage dioxygenase [Ohtaekwangia sp.]
MTTNHIRITLLLMSMTYGMVYAQSKNDRHVGGRCEGCELLFEGIPDKVYAATKISPAGEKGEPLMITGTIFKHDGKTPAPGVILYLYHTDATGKYTPSTDQAFGKRHGHLRGWVKTNANGKYQFTTIRPGAYPNGSTPQHIHATIKEPGIAPYWIDDYLFTDDPFVTEEIKTNQRKRGGSGLIKLTRSNGLWTGNRDIVLGGHIADY